LHVPGIRDHGHEWAAWAGPVRSTGADGCGPAGSRWLPLDPNRGAAETICPSRPSHGGQVGKARSNGRVGKVAMSRNAVSDVNPKAKPDDEAEDLAVLSADDKVDDVLETLDIAPAVASEEPGPQAEELEPAPEEDEREAIEESLSPEDPVRLYLREIGRITLLTAEREVVLGRQMEQGQERVRR